jgi:hypothetical protein
MRKQQGLAEHLLVVENLPACVDDIRPALRLPVTGCIKLCLCREVSERRRSRTVEFQDHQPQIGRRVYDTGDAASIVGDRGGVRDDVVAPARFHRLLRAGVNTATMVSPTENKVCVSSSQRQYRAAIRVYAEHLADEHPFSATL